MARCVGNDGNLASAESLQSSRDGTYRRGKARPKPLAFNPSREIRFLRVAKYSVIRVGSLEGIGVRFDEPLLAHMVRPAQFPPKIEVHQENERLASYPMRREDLECVAEEDGYLGRIVDVDRNGAVRPCRIP